MLCYLCIGDTQRRLGDLPHLAQALRTFLGGSMAVAYTSKVSRTSTPQAPMNVHVADLLDDIGDVIDRAGGLDTKIRDLIQQPAEKFRLWIKGQPRDTYLSGVDRALDIRRIHSKVEDMVGFSKIWHRRVAPCPECQLPTLGAWSGEDAIQCSNEDCLAQFTKDEYELHCLKESKKK